MKTLRSLLIITILLLVYIAALVVILYPWLGVVIGAAVLMILARRGVNYTAYGTARWADATTDLQHLLEGDGLIVGHINAKPTKFAGVKALFNSRVSDRDACQRFLLACQRTSRRQLVRLTNAVHIAAFSPPGGGKSTGLALPFLLTCPDSIVCVDIKGELTKAAAETRRRMGHRVVVIDPFRLTTDHPDTFNPLSGIDKDSPTAMNEIEDLAEALVIKNPQEREPHWSQSAANLISGTIAGTVCFADGGNNSLQTVRAVLANPEKLQAAIAAMCESDMWEGNLARQASSLTHYKEKELSSVLTTTNRYLKFLDSPAIAASARESSFDPSELTTGKMTVFIVIPPEHLRALIPLLRMLISCMLRAVVKGGLQDSRKVHFLIDEAAALGHMEAIDDALDQYRSYGVRLILLYQALGQLKRCFPDGQDQTVLSNVTQVFFGVNDKDTADYVSSRLGEKTITVDSGGSSYGGSRSGDSGKGSPSTSTSWNRSENWSQLGRKLLKSEEVTALPGRVAITFTPGVPPIATWMVRSYENDFHPTPGMGLWRSAFDTACLFATAAMIAFVFTGILFNQLR